MNIDSDAATRIFSAGAWTNDRRDNLRFSETRLASLVYEAGPRKRVVVIGPGGGADVLAHDLEGDAEKEGAVAVFVGNAANQVGEALALGTFERGVVAIGKDRMLVLEQPDYYVGLLLGERASPALVTSQAESIFR